MHDGRACLQAWFVEAMVVVEFFRAFDFSAIKNVAGVKTIRQEEEVRGATEKMQLNYVPSRS
jgi:hypothetical protein